MQDGTRAVTDGTIDVELEEELLELEEELLELPEELLESDSHAAARGATNVAAEAAPPIWAMISLQKKKVTKRAATRAGPTRNAALHGAGECGTLQTSLRLKLRDVFAVAKTH